MEKRYSELSHKYESEVSKSEHGLPEKCRKCEELTKTVFRMNSLLNPKRNV